MAAPHDFSRFIRTIGRGPALSRALTEAEAEEAMGSILRGAVEPEQIGAMMIVLRYRKETPEELAGFVRASRALMPRAPDAGVALDWPSYADRHKQIPYFVLAARLLADAGVRILMHGLAGEGPVTTPKALAAIGVEPSAGVDDAARRLDATNLAYLPLDKFCAPLLRLFALRPVLGLRSPANTFARMLNPFGAPYQVQGVFHPNYLAVHQAAAQRLGQPFLAAFKGGGGEVQRNPEKPTRVITLTDGAPGEEEWPALTANARYPWRDEPLDTALLRDLWSGEDAADAPVAAVIGTAAVALRLLGRADSPEAAEAAARDLWQNRRKKLG
jgi:anthranilate phosphoribosyltransferase